MLNPHWVTEWHLQVLNSRRLEEQNGELSVGDLGSMLDQREIPAGDARLPAGPDAEVRPLLQLPGRPAGRYLIPELLDKQQPPEAARVRAGRMPEFPIPLSGAAGGAAARASSSARMRSATGSPRWRSGVILQFEGYRALVKADVQERKVLISVTGPRTRPAQPARDHPHGFRAHSRRHQEAAAAGDGAGAEPPGGRTPI